MATVYLAGPIDNVSLNEASGWREQAAALLNESGHLVCDPNRVWVLSEAQRKSLSPHELGAIVGVDLFAVQTVDALLVWCDRDTRMCGTYIETGWALMHDKTIAFYSPCGGFPGFVSGLRESISTLVDSASKVELFTDLGRACDWLDSVFKGRRI
jgi:nucleoside 2-deoxyribosyltransferase